MSAFNQDDSIIFAGSSDKKGTNTKGYYQTSIGNITHIKIDGKSEFLSIADITSFFVRGNKDQVVTLQDIIKNSDDSDDSSANDSKVEYSCMVGDKEFNIEPKAYAIISTMVGVSDEEVAEIDKQKSENKKAPDLFYRCDDGVYVNREDLEPPAFKFVESAKNKFITSNNSNIDVMVAVLKDADSTRIEISKDQIIERDGKKYIVYKSQEIEIKTIESSNVEISKVYLQTKETTEEGAEIIVDRIVDLSRISQESGKFYANLTGDEKLELGEIDIQLDEPVVERIEASVKGTATNQETLIEFVPTEQSYNNGYDAHSYQSKLNLTGGRRLIYKFDDNSPSPAGEIYEGKTLSSIEVSNDKNSVTLVYGGYWENGKHIDEVKRVFVKKEFASKYTKTNKNNYAEIIELDDFVVEDLGNGRIKFAKLEQQKDVQATEVEYEDGLPKSFKLNDTKVEDIVYGKNGSIQSYKIGGVEVYDITWDKNGDIKYCSIKGEINQRSVDLKDLGKNSTSPISKSNFSSLCIRNIQRTPEREIIYDQITDIKWDDITGSVGSFKLGNKVFKNINWANFEQFKIYTCDIDVYDHEGNLIESNIAEVIEGNKDYDYLKVTLTTKLNEDIVKRLEMLKHSTLLRKEDGTYVKEADVVQKSAEKDGMADAKPIETAEQAREAKDEFQQNPDFMTYVVDEDGTAHELSNTDELFKEDSDFHQDISNTITDILGKNKIEYAKGDIKLKRSMAEEDAVAIPFQIGGALCSTGILIPLGLPLMALAGINNLIGNSIRAVRKHRIKNYDIDKMTKKMQDDVMNNCEEKINKLSQDFVSKMSRARKNLTEAEFAKFQAQEEKSFRQQYMKEVGNLQVLSNGGLKCPFDMGAKSKITNENYIGYLAARKQQKEILEGKSDSPQLGVVLGAINKNFNSKLDDLSNQKAKMEERIKLNPGNDYLLKESHKIQQAIDTLQADNMQVKLNAYKQYGGAKGMTEAYKIESSLEYIKNSPEYKEAETQEQMDAVIKAKQDTAKQNYEEYMAKNGSLEDRIKYGLKNSAEYKVATRAEKRKMIEDYRKAEHTRASKVTVDTVEFEQRTNGEQSLVGSIGKSAVAHMEDVLRVSREGSTNKAPTFDVKKATVENIQGESFVKGMAPRANTNASQVSQDANRTASRIREIATDYAKTHGRDVENIRAKAEEVENSGDYVTAFKEHLKARVTSKQVKQEAENYVEKLSILTDDNGQKLNSELYSTQQQDIIDTISSNAEDYGKECVKIDSIMTSLKTGYARDVKRRSAEEFKEGYKDQICAFALKDNLNRTNLQGSLNNAKSKAEQEFIEKYIDKNKEEYIKFSDKYTRRSDIGVSEINEKFVNSNKKKFAAFKAKFKGKASQLVQAYIKEYESEYTAFYDKFTGRSSATETEKQEAFVNSYLTGERRNKFEESKAKHINKRTIEFLHTDKVESEILKKYLTEFIKSDSKLEDVYKQKLIKNDDEKIIEAKVLVAEDKDMFKIFAKSNKFSLDNEQEKLRATLAYYLMIKEKNNERLEALRKQNDYDELMLKAAVEHYKVEREAEVELDDEDEVGA